MKKPQNTLNVIIGSLLFLCMLLFANELKAQLNLDIIGDGALTGGFKIGTTTSSVDGTIRYNGTNFQGYANGSWKSMTSPWAQSNNSIGYKGGTVFMGTQANPNLLYFYGEYVLQNDERVFNMPGWTPTSDKVVRAGVFSGRGTYAPVIRFNAPNNAYAEFGVDTLGSLNFYTGGSKEMTLRNSSGYLGLGTEMPTNKLHVQDDVAGVQVIKGEYTGTQSDIAGVYGENDDHDYYGYGVHGKGGYIGVYGQVTPTGDSSYRGVVGQVSGGSGENVGVWASASGSGRNYAVYASGDIKVTSQLFIGTSTAEEDLVSDYSLAVDGKAIVEEMVVELSGDWPDYVFEEDYQLKSLTEVKSFIDENGHLPEIPSAKEMEASDGVAVGEMQRLLVQKIEELTLYMIELEKKNVELEAEINALKKQ